MQAKQQRKGPKIVDLVTGPTSGLGIELINRLLKMGHEVRVLIREHPSKSRSWTELPPNVKPYKVDIRLPAENDRTELLLACKGVDNLFHIAGTSYNHQNKYNEIISINVIGTENVLDAYVKANPGKRLHFILTSSVTVYGYMRKGEALTEESEIRPASKYSESKVLAEQVSRSFATVNKELICSVLRFGVFYGGKYKESFFKVFRILKAKKMVYIGRGENYLTLTNVEDAARAMIQATNDTHSNTYNVVEKPVMVRRLFEYAAKEMKVESPKTSIPYILGRMTRRIVNINIDEFEFVTSNRVVSSEKIERELGFKPSHSILKDGKKMIKEFLEGEKSRVIK